MGKLYLNKPNRPQDAPITVPGLGVFKNGGEYDIPGDEDIYIPPQQEDEDTLFAPVGQEPQAVSLEENDDTEEGDN